MSHLLYADDALRLLNGQTRNIRKIMKFVNNYEDSSGQKINHANSSFLMAKAAPTQLASKINRITGFHRQREGRHFFAYGTNVLVGVPPCLLGCFTERYLLIIALLNVVFLSLPDAAVVAIDKKIFKEAATPDQLAVLNYFGFMVFGFFSGIHLEVLAAYVCAWIFGGIYLKVLAAYIFVPCSVFTCNKSTIPSTPTMACKSLGHFAPIILLLVLLSSTDVCRAARFLLELPKPELPPVPLPHEPIIPKLELPPLPEVPHLPKVEVPPLPHELPKPELPPLPEVPHLPKPELPPLPEAPHLPTPELPHEPVQPKPELPTLPEVPQLTKPELPPLPHEPVLPKPELPPLPEAPHIPKPELPVPPKPELPPLPEAPHLPKPELPPVPHVPELPKPEIPKLPETPHIPKPELPPVPHVPELPKLEIPKLPEEPKLPPLPHELPTPKPELPPLPHELPKPELPSFPKP
ncbi:hypothetical protein Taro_022717 [Colocasia esculenta]|uniref:Uncharacterized protein n=1 Tax=Colocasia esculenta TaxID=4460 RepID=A0A843V232_COLES|nr:hypothetical protein [Colocasia esculenta]